MKSAINLNFKGLHFWTRFIALALGSVIIGFGSIQLRAQVGVKNQEFNRLLQGLLDHNVPEIGVNEACTTNPVLFLDAREQEEFEVSHLPGATWVGYDNFQWERMSEIAKDQPIVVYCSVGYRSERISKKLIAAGYSRVFNLYGGIFEWTNSGYPVENQNGPVKTVHTYNKDWSRWVTKASKIY